MVWINLFKTCFKPFGLVDRVVFNVWFKCYKVYIAEKQSNNLFEFLINCQIHQAQLCVLKCCPCVDVRQLQKPKAVTLLIRSNCSNIADIKKISLLKWHKTDLFWNGGSEKCSNWINSWFWTNRLKVFLENGHIPQMFISEHACFKMINSYDSAFNIRGGRLSKLVFRTVKGQARIH